MELFLKSKKSNTYIYIYINEPVILMDQWDLIEPLFEITSMIIEDFALIIYGLAHNAFEYITKWGKGLLACELHKM